MTPLSDLPRRHYGAILCDPPWRFKTWSAKGEGRAPKYKRMKFEELARLPVAELAAPHCVLFLWFTWPMLLQATRLIEAWGFKYKTCGYSWTKVNKKDGKPWGGTGYWTKANNESCLLATRGKPKRIKRDVKQAVVEPRRQHSRKPDCVHERIERLVAGPYLELFARQQHPGWIAWGDQVNQFSVPGASND